MYEPTKATGTITSFGELIGTLPLLLGFPPSNSLVLVSHTSSVPALSAVLRVDLPATNDIPALVAQLRDVLLTGDAVTVTAVILSNDLDGNDLDSEVGSGFVPAVPHRTLVDALTNGLGTVQITVEHAVWASGTEPGTRWRCYCPGICGGSVPALDTSSVAASLIVAGATSAGSRDQLAATLAADPADHLERRAAMLDTRRHADRATVATPDSDSAHRIVQDAIAAAAGHPGLPVLTDDQIVNLAWALSDPHVRDRCLTAALPDLPAGTRTGTAAVPDHADAAERLWTVLTRAVPPPARAEPAFLLAVHTHLRGSSVLASIALEIACDADPDHILAWLLRLAIQRGMPPTQLQRLLQKALATARDTHR